MRLRYELLEQRYLLAADFAEDLAAPPASSSVAPITWFETFKEVERISLESLSNVDSTLAPEVAGPLPLATGEWIVQLTDGAAHRLRTLSNADNLLDSSAIDFTIISGLGIDGVMLVRGQGVSQHDIETSLHENLHVESFSLNKLLKGQATLPNDPDFVDMTNLNNVGQFGATADADIDAAEAWDLEVGSSSVVVGVIDSGIDVAHPDLYLNIWLNQGEIPVSKLNSLTDTDSDGLITFYDLNASVNASFVRDLNTNGYIDAVDLLQDPLWGDGVDTDDNGFIDDFFGWNFRTGVGETFAKNDPRDSQGHGTHVAGTIGAVGNNASGVVGVNWKTSLMSLKFLDQNNQGDTAAAIAAVNYATMMRSEYETNVRVLNSSWGQPGGYNSTLQQSISESGDAGILFVAAAGNGNVLGQGVDNNLTPFYPASYDVENIVAVAATNNKDQLAPFSNFGQTAVDIAAPGVGTLSTLPGARFESANGTSMATPLVSGVAALLAAHKPDVTVTELKAALLQGADSIPALDGLIASGRRLNALGALTAPTFAPRVSLQSVSPITASGEYTKTITVRYTDEQGVNLATLGDTDILVTRPGFAALELHPTLDAATIDGSNKDFTVEYVINAPRDTWQAIDNGTYTISLKFGEVRNVKDIATSRQVLGTFAVDIADSTVFFVNSTDDAVDASPGDGVAQDASGRTTLRAAIQEANATPGDNTIVVPDGQYLLTIQGRNDDASATGDLDINDSVGTLYIVGGGNSFTFINANQIDRVVDVRPNASLSLEAISLRNGFSDNGGGLRNEGGIVDLRMVSVDGNQATTDGGGIHSTGTLTINQSLVHDNETLDPLANGGGGIFNDGELSMSQSTVYDNTTAGGFIKEGGGGGLFNALNGNADLSVSTFSGNVSTNGDGGGFFTSGTLKGNHLTISRNAAPLGDGGGASSATKYPHFSAITNTIVAGNISASHFDTSGNIGRSSGVLIGISSDTSPLAFEAELLGSIDKPLDAMLGPLQFNGFATPSHEPLPGSPVIDAANGNSILLDQRGVSMPQEAGDGTRFATAIGSAGEHTSSNISTAVNGNIIYYFFSRELKSHNTTTGVT
ncbi:S8 family peptidase [Rosistilla oblonga]|uniref:S8 family peptidase n=1 Tax=Rosistilla oblonga TaxID=2527990 RepID=UPI0018D26BAB|nr:S8 family peptidase [Rosistilla oblonga]